MTCTDAIEILDRMIFEEVPADAGLREHIDTCSSCSQAYWDALKAREVMNQLRRSEPELRDPGGLTGNIMAAIEKGPEKTFVVPLLLTRLLAAASVVLFLLFGYEQYGLVRKISVLEKQCAEIKSDPRYSDFLQKTSTINISEAGISFSEIERILSAKKGRTSIFFSFSKNRLEKRNKK
jgi:hypothetical protein